MAVVIKVCDPYQVPIGRKCWAVGAADENIVIEIPDRGLLGTGRKQGIIRMAVLIKIGRSPQSPAAWKSWAVGAADENVIVKIPYRCLVGAGVVEQIVRAAVAVKVSYDSPGYTHYERMWVNKLADIIDAVERRGVSRRNLQWNRIGNEPRSEVVIIA